MNLLNELCKIHAPAGNEGALRDYILNYVEQNKDKWLTRPAVYSGDGFQDCIMLVFGQPRTAIYAHLDSHGFTVRYSNQLVEIGGPDLENGYELTGSDSQGKIDCKLRYEEEDHKLEYEFHRPIDRGTDLVYKCNFKEEEDFIQSCYLDNRLGVWVALKVAETLKDGIIFFSCYEEHGGGSAGFLAQKAYEKYGVLQSLICDITWVTEGVTFGNGVAISMRDRNIPRRRYINKVIDLATQSGIPFQLEVEGAGGSDGREIQMSPYPVDWVFIGAPEKNVHSPKEQVHKKDIKAMVAMYRFLMERM